jgi:hypothetical protein
LPISENQRLISLSKKSCKLSLPARSGKRTGIMPGKTAILFFFASLYNPPSTKNQRYLTGLSGRKHG